VVKERRTRLALSVEGFAEGNQDMNLWRCTPDEGVRARPNRLPRNDARRNVLSNNLGVSIDC
jgi:hypothetical protein